MSVTLRDYYDRRLPEYDELYRRPERQRDLATLRSLVQSSLANERVLELACGTGYWTQVAAKTAASVVASDSSAAALDVARERVTQQNVRFRIGDALAARSMNEDHFTAVLAAFWWSHVARATLPGFLAHLATALGTGRRGVFIDNRYVAGSSTPISRTDGDGNTYQQRYVQDGSEFEILKNFPTRMDRQSQLGQVAERVELRELRYYWYAECVFRPA